MNRISAHLEHVQAWWRTKQLRIVRQNKHLEQNVDFSKHHLTLQRCLALIARAIPVASAMLLAACTSTGSTIDVSGTNLASSLATQQTTGLSQSAMNPSTPEKLSQVSPSANLGFAGSEQSAAAQNDVTINASSTSVAPKTPTGVQIVSAPDAEQLDKNSKLVATAAAASANAPAMAKAEDGVTTVLTTPESDLKREKSDKISAVKEVAAAPLVDSATKQTLPSKQTDTAILTTAPPAEQVITAAPATDAPDKKKSLFEALFTSSKKSNTQKSAPDAPSAQEPVQLALASSTPREPETTAVAVKPVLQPINLELKALDDKITATQEQASATSNDVLPGVRKGALFEIKRRDSLQDDTDVDIGETDSGPVLLASAGGMARLAPNGLNVQRQGVDVTCLKPQLVKILKKIENHFQSPVVVTSGFRNPGYNRRVRGAKNSLHMYCAAADVQVVGIPKWELARYARSMPGRGGVGTYCHTESIHIDVGPDRDWNWRCSRRK